MSAIEILEEKENKLLARMEYVLNFKGGSGLISRQAAADAVASKLGVPKEGVSVVSLRSKFGDRNLKGIAFVYSDRKDKTRQLPKYMIIRELPKEERKKAREAAKPKAEGAAGAPEAQKKS